MLEAVQTDGSTSFRGFGAGTLLCVLPVGGDLSFSGHGFLWLEDSREGLGIRGWRWRVTGISHVDSIDFYFFMACDWDAALILTFCFGESGACAMRMCNAHGFQHPVAE